MSRIWEDMKRKDSKIAGGKISNLLISNGWHSWLGGHK